MKILALMSLLLLTQSAYAATVELTWDDPHNAPGTVTEYRIERSGDRQTTWEQIGISPAQTLTFQDPSATTAHCYRVRAANASAVSEPSNVACVPPVAPVGVSVTITVSGIAQ